MQEFKAFTEARTNVVVTVNATMVSVYWKSGGKLPRLWASALNIGAACLLFQAAHALVRQGVYRAQFTRNASIL